MKLEADFQNQKNGGKSVKMIIQKNFPQFQKLTDKEIWQKLQNGDDNALCYIYRVYANHLYQFGCQLTHNKEIVKDCIQDLFILLRKRSFHLGNVISIKSYLYKSLYRAILKAKANHKFISLNQNEDFSINISTETSIIEGELWREKVKVVEKEMNLLNQKQKQAITHFFYNGFNYEEIAYIMDLSSKDASRMLINRGLKAIRKNLSKYKNLLLPIGLLTLFSQFQILF
ncbi:RNA polymerase sigma factor [Flexithrix dorotheae]|uniref:RNA polymerase sigma factor n=1 Tax=Flexithrix dorotheae TaxID=70993 RepID=UPI00036C55C9|nr:sigma-70 family RNA polymerase sigma factor [Flexithrix dorotheae]